jgi:hypothetical protein
MSSGSPKSLSPSETLLICDDCELGRTITLTVSGMPAGGGCCDDLNGEYELTYSDRIQCGGFGGGETTWWLVWESDSFSIAGCNAGIVLSNRKWVFAIPESGETSCFPVLKLTAAAADPCDAVADNRTAAMWKGDALLDCDLPIELNGLFHYGGGWPDDCDFDAFALNFEIE